MKILFMGTPEFAAKSLKALIEDHQNICAVYTQPDKAKGRSNKLLFSPVKELALEYSIPVFQPEKIKNSEVIEQIVSLKPDIICVVAYGKLLPDEIIDCAPNGTINIHGSLLPKYRGSAPVQWAVINGDKITGVTSMYISSEMDAGDIIDSVSTEIGYKETSSHLMDRLADIGAELLVKTIHNISGGKVCRIKQDSNLVSYAPMLSKDLSPLDFTMDVNSLLCRIYGLQDWPCATFQIGNTVFTVYEAETGEKTDRNPGEIIYAGKKGIEISCAGGNSIRITELKAPGGKRMPASAYLLGHKLEDC